MEGLGLIGIGFNKLHQKTLLFLTLISLQMLPRKGR